MNWYNLLPLATEHFVFFFKAVCLNKVLLFSDTIIQRIHHDQKQLPAAVEFLSNTSLPETHAI